MLDSKTGQIYNKRDKIDTAFQAYSNSIEIGQLYQPCQFISQAPVASSTLKTNWYKSSVLLICLIAEFLSCFCAQSTPENTGTELHIQNRALTWIPTFNIALSELA